MRKRLALVALFLTACLFLGPAAGQQGGGKELFKIEFDPEKDWRKVEKDDEGKEGLVLEVSFKLKRNAEIQARAGQYRIIVEEDKSVRAKRDLTLLSDKLTAVLAVDISNSMELIDNEETGERRIDAAKKAAKIFFNSLDKGVDCGLILFDDKLQTVEPPCGDAKKVAAHRKKLIKLVESAEPRGGTAYIDAIERAVQMLEKVKEGRKAIVLVTDGVDLHSKAKLDKVIPRAKKANIAIWTIGIGEPGKSLRSTVVMALDKSGSMREPADNDDPTPKIKALHKAATQFIDDLHPQAELSLLPFSTQVGTPGKFTRSKKDRERLKDSVRALEPEGETAFLSAAYTAAATLDAYNPTGMRLVVVLTDGIDNSSRHRLDDVIARAKEARVRLFMLAFGRENELDRVTMEKLALATKGAYQHARNEKELTAIFKQLTIDLDDKGINEEVLREIATETKGTYQHARDLRNLSGIFQKLAQDVQSRYTIRFQSQRQAQDGTARAISIYVVETEVVKHRDAAGNIVETIQERKVSDVVGTQYVTRGVVVPQMHSLIYLAFLGGLGLLIAVPVMLRRMTKPASDS
jgi:VWFA-related protein